jgi:hypothetical protein
MNPLYNVLRRFVFERVQRSSGAAGVMGGRAAIHILPVWQQYGDKMAQPTERIQNTDESPGCLGILFRLFWMLGGVAILILVGIDIVLKSYRVLSIVLYWLTVVAIIVARLFDIRFFRGETYDGKPATMKHWVRHAALLLASSSVFFMVLLLLKRFRVFN